MFLHCPSDWRDFLHEIFSLEKFQKLSHEISMLYGDTVCYPAKENILNAFYQCSFEGLKVVIIGQDPYHGKGQANGLCFAVLDGIPHPPSLKNIFKELQTDVGKSIPVSGNLSSWAKQGVLLLNATLTVRANEAGSHQKRGWEEFTDAVIKQVSEQREQLVFLLWGKFAESKIALIDTKKHQVFTAPHPSPLGAWRGWFGSKHFSKTNEYLKKNHQKEIVW